MKHGPCEADSKAFEALVRERDEALTDLEREQESCEESAGLLLKAEAEVERLKVALQWALSHFLPMDVDYEKARTLLASVEEP